MPSRRFRSPVPFSCPLVPAAPEVFSLTTLLHPVVKTRALMHNLALPQTATDMADRCGTFKSLSLLASANATATFSLHDCLTTSQNDAAALLPKSEGYVIVP